MKAPKQPKRRFPGISARWTGGAWKWRALVKIDGRQIVGEYRATQEEAVADGARLRATGAPAVKGQAPTLGWALEAVREDAIERGISEEYYEANDQVHARYLLRFWQPDTRLAAITQSEVEWFVKLSLASQDEDGHPKKPRVASTLVGKDLRLLKLCFKRAELPCPVDKARNIPKKNRPLTHFFTVEEARSLLQQMREGVFRDANGRTIELPERQHHADLVQLILMSGIRVGELARVRTSDVDLPGARIQVKSKVKALPRWIALQPELVQIAERLLARAADRGEELLVPGGVAYISGVVCAKWKRRLDEPRLAGRTLRHTAITAVLQAGATLPETMHFAGHVNVATTGKYVHALKDREGTTAGRLAGLFSGEQKARPA